LTGPAATESVTRPAEVAEAARIITGAGLVEAFGHVSARAGDGFMITSTSPLGDATADDVLCVPADAFTDGERTDPTTARTGEVPLEAPLHAAVYAARPDVAAICRTHSPAAVRAGLRGGVPPVLHGLGGLTGEVALCDRFDLVTDRDAGDEVATALGGADCLLIKGNGSVCVGESLADAVVRARYLEERCLVGEGSAVSEGPGGAELAARARWFEKERVRAWAWMRWRYATTVSCSDEKRGDR
jgi:ribulose-5-phosphate 4-epimerase/fuculose-1-phosphate aldolase